MRNGKIFLWSIICIAVFLLSIYAGMRVLFWIDINHEVLRDAWKDFAGVKNHYSGNDWFSVCVTIVGSVISSVPGIACGIFALVQTQRLHELEDRYHRPMLGVVNVTTRFIPLENEEVSGVVLEETNEYSLDIPQRKVLSTQIDKKQKWYMDFKVDFGVKNEIELHDMWVMNITIYLNDQKYKLYSGISLILHKLGFLRDIKHIKQNLVNFREGTRHFEHKYDVNINQKSYTLKWNLEPEKCENIDGNLSEGIQNFVYYDGTGDMKFHDMKIVVQLNGKYEYGKNKKPSLFLIINLNAEKCKNGKKVVVINNTSNAYFLYEYK